MKNIFCFALITLFFSGLLPCTLCAQMTSIKLPVADTSGSFRVLSNAGASLLRVNGDGGFYIGGTSSVGTIPTTGAGVRLMWHPAKAAFRVGYVSGAGWDDTYIGYNSIATGFNALASGSYSTALGYSSEASGSYSTALGYNATASGNHSIAMGYNTTASETYNVAIGYNATSSGGIAIGTNTAASGGNATALGNHTTASGFNSTAMGINSIASGDHSTALGAYMKASKYGSFVIGDISKTTHDSSSEMNQMTMRFKGGYRLFTNSDCSDGVYMIEGDAAWRSVCDRNKKENFHPVDGEQILLKIKEIPITEWNYKGNDPSIKYIGPVAQDFYAAFHLGGTDSLGISTLCFDGINIAAIQALVKRTEELNIALNELKAEKEKTVQLLASFDELKSEIAKMKSNIQTLTEAKTGQTGSDFTLNTMHKGNGK